MIVLKELSYIQNSKLVWSERGYLIFKFRRKLQQQQQKNEGWESGEKTILCSCNVLAKAEQWLM